MAVKLPIYMDNNSTTRTDPRVVEAMLPYLTEKFGNAASRSHPYGWEAEAGVEEARERIAALVGAKPKDVVITCATEHHSVVDVCRALEKNGLARVTLVPVDKTGRVDPEDVGKAIGDDTVLVSIMAGNNEIGTIQPIAEIGRV